MLAKVYLNGTYPCMANWVVLRRREGKIFARNCLLDEEDEITEREARYLLRLNGRRNPLSIRGFSCEECEEYFEQVNDQYLLRTPERKLVLDSMKLYTLFIPREMRARSVLPRVLNDLLLSLCIPLLLFGIYRVFCCGVHFNDTYTLTGSVVGLLIGIVLHELGHTVACLGYGGRWMEAGVMRRGLIPGAYVLIDYSGIRSRLKKVQINLAGVEMNLLLAGVLLTVFSYADDCRLLYYWSGAASAASLQNILLVCLNLTFVEGFDGEQVISLLLGKESAVGAARASVRCLFDRRKRRRYFEREGINGLANVLVGSIILLFQLLIPILILAEIIVLAEVYVKCR